MDSINSNTTIGKSKGFDKYISQTSSYDYLFEYAECITDLLSVCIDYLPKKNGAVDFAKILSRKEVKNIDEVKTVVDVLNTFQRLQKSGKTLNRSLTARRFYLKNLNILICKFFHLLPAQQFKHTPLCL